MTEKTGDDQPLNDFKSRLKHVLVGEDGQAMVEYVIIVAFMVGALMSYFALFPAIIRDYYRGIAILLSLPIP